MKKILIIANYRKSIGGISGQVEILLEKFNNDEMFSSEAKYWKEKLNKTLTSYLSLDAMTLNVSECITMFTQSTL